jgi:hypothetical protein
LSTVPYFRPVRRRRAKMQMSSPAMARAKTAPTMPPMMAVTGGAREDESGAADAEGDDEAGTVGLAAENGAADEGEPPYCETMAKSMSVNVVPTLSRMTVCIPVSSPDARYCGGSAFVRPKPRLLTRRICGRNITEVPLYGTGTAPSNETEYNPWFNETAPYSCTPFP